MLGAAVSAKLTKTSHKQSSRKAHMTTEKYAIDEAKVRKAFKVSAPSALLLGGVMVLWPSVFWRWLGIELVGTAIFPAVLYGCVIFGVGLASIAAARAPRQHLGILLLLTCYKGTAVVALLGHAALQLLADQPVPWPVWVIAAMWLSQAVSNARLYPWGITDQ